MIKVCFTLASSGIDERHLGLHYYQLFLLVPLALAHSSMVGVDPESRTLIAEAQTDE